MPEQLVQISKRTGRVERVRNGQTPVVEIYLSPGEYVAQFSLDKRDQFRSERKTTDWAWVAYVVTPLGVPETEVSDG